MIYHTNHGWYNLTYLTNLTYLLLIDIDCYWLLIEDYY